eukprot:6474625-Amphidinium_carterae.1
MSGVHASCVEDWIRHHRAAAHDGEVPKCSVCKQPYRGTEQRPGPLSFMSHLCQNFCKQALRSAFLVGMLFAYWIGVQEDVVDSLLGYSSGVQSARVGKVEWITMGMGHCLDETQQVPQYFEVNAEIADETPDDRDMPATWPCQRVCELHAEDCIGVSLTLHPGSHCLIHSSAPPPGVLFDGPYGGQAGLPIVDAGSMPLFGQDAWTCYKMDVTWAPEETKISSDQRMMRLLVRAVLLTAS